MPVGTPFQPGNKAAAGKGPGFLALRRRFIREYLSIELADSVLGKMVKKAVEEGDTAAAKFVFDYCGEKPVEHVQQMQTLVDPKLQQLAAERGWDFPDAE